jgi:hypothetical protein
MSNVILPNLGAVNRLITDASPQPTLFSTLYSLGLTIKTDHLTNEIFDSPNPRAERLPTPAPAPRIPTYPRPSAPGAYQARELRGSRPRDGGNLESLHPASSANRNLDMDVKHDFAETEVGFLLLPPHLEQSSSAHGHVQSFPPTRPALSTLMGGRIDLSRLSFQHYLESSKRLTISGPDLLFEPKDLAGANASSLLLDCRSAEELSHGRLWKVFQAKIWGVDKDQFECDPDHTTVVMDGAKGETSLAKGEGEGEDDIIKCLTSVRAKPRISAISSDLGNTPGRDVVLKLVLIESNSFEQEDEDGSQLGFDPEQAVLNEAELYYGPLASLQGVVVPHCYGLFVASTEYGRGRYWAMILDRLVGFSSEISWTGLNRPDR